MKWSFAALRMSYESLQDCMAVTNPNISTCSQRTKEITNFRNLIDLYNSAIPYFQQLKIGIVTAR